MWNRVCIFKFDERLRLERLCGEETATITTQWPLVRSAMTLPSPKTMIVVKEYRKGKGGDRETLLSICV